MAGLVFGLVGGAIRAVTGNSRDHHHDHIVVAPCTCHQSYCQQCTVDPVWMSRRELRREAKYERRAMKHARKAARWGYPAAVYHSHSQPGQQGYVQQPPQGYSQQAYPQQQQVYQSVPPQQTQYRSVPNDQAPRRASFDEEDLLDQPPQYEPGDWQQRQQQQRRSVEVLTSDRKN